MYVFLLRLLKFQFFLKFLLMVNIDIWMNEQG
jgi:hypothetical protein